MSAISWNVIPWYSFRMIAVRCSSLRDRIASATMALSSRRATRSSIDSAGSVLGQQFRRIDVFWHLRDRGSLLPADPVATEIQRDPVEPGRKLRLSLEAGQRPIRAQERVLADVARILFPSRERDTPGHRSAAPISR